MFMKVSGSALLLAGLIGCSSGRAPSPSTAVAPAPAPPTIAAVAGDYTLVAVDGHALPYVPRSRAGTVDALARPVTSGTFTLSASGTFRIETILGAAGNGTSTTALSGACYTEGDQVKMVWDEGLADMAVRGDTVLVKREGIQYAYLRRR